jgi:hypothetical protein
MSNMSYCRFQNTLNDFRDCLQYVREFGLQELSPEEAKAAERLRRLAFDFIEDYDSNTALDS